VRPHPDVSASATLIKETSNIVPRRGERRRDAEENAAHDRHYHDKCEHASVEV
jgi:hypothetical protein